MQDATALLNEIVGALEGLANQTLSLVPNDQSFLEIWGWNCPPVTRNDFASLIRGPIAVIQSLESKELEDEDLQKLSVIPARITYISQNALPNLPSANSGAVYAVVKALIESIDEVLGRYAMPAIDWNLIESKNLIPTQQLKRLRLIDRSVSTLLDESKSLGSKIAEINDAHGAAESLPTDIESLRIARADVELALKNTMSNQAAAELARGSAEEALKRIASLEAEATKLVQSTGDAFSAATTKGLGEEFGLKAIALAVDVKWLGTFLFLTLAAGATITFYRIQYINELIKGATINIDLVWAHVFLTLASLAAPVWLAWIITKQIGQRFRLSEDYAFKASVAKAYGGYRQEAARLDPEFEKRLYATALSRIEEAPLRYVEVENHGSPWHELFRLRRKANVVAETTQTDTPVA